MSPLAYSHWTTPNALATAWRRVRRKKGAGGLDGQSIEAFAQDADTELQRLQAELETETYRPSRLLRIDVPKPDGTARALRIPTVRDRIVQGAFADALSHRLDPLMSDASHAYRPGRSVESAAGRAVQLMLQGWVWAVRLDIARFFDKVPHSAVIAALRPHTDYPSRRVLGQWLNAQRCGRTGLAQGGPASPVLSNWVLTPFDQEINRGKARLIRYADDMLILTRTEHASVGAQERTTAALATLGLAPNPAKTRVGHVSKGVEFLGLRFDGTTVHRHKA